MAEREIAITEATRQSGYSGRHLRRLARQGAIKARQVSKRFWLIDSESLAAYVQRMRDLGDLKHGPA